MPFTIRTNRCGEKLADDSNHVYRIDRRRGDISYWKCEAKKCNARVHTTNRISSVTIFKEVNEHNHPSNPTKPAVYACLAKIKSDAAYSSLSSRALIGEALTSISSEGHSILVSLSSISRTIRNRRKQSMQAPPIPKSRNGYSIPENFKFLASGEPFLLYDSGICDINRILVFGTEAGLNALEKYCEWAADGTFRLCPEIYYQLYTVTY